MHLTLIAVPAITAADVEDLPRAIEVVGHTSIEVSLNALRRWDPDQGTVRPLAGVDPNPAGHVA